MGLRLKAKTPSVMSLSEWSASMPIRKLCRKEIRLHKNSQAKQHSGPRDDLGLEKLVRRHGRPVKCRGEQDIEIEHCKWRDQEIGLVYATEFHRFDALPSQDRDSGQHHPKQQNDCECPEIFRHLILSDHHARRTELHVPLQVRPAIITAAERRPFGLNS